MNQTEQFIFDLMSELGIKTQSELAKKLNVAHNTISVWKTKDAFESVVKAAALSGINIQNITGVGASGNDHSVGKIINTHIRSAQHPLLAEFEKLCKAAEALDQIEYLEKCMKKCKLEILERAKL